jgi:glycosyltransferase involved in cell wall biosynthesis
MNGSMLVMDDFFKFDYKQFNRETLLTVLSRFGVPHRLRILYISTYQPRYTRTESLLSLFSENGIQVKAVLAGGSKFKYLTAVRDLVRYGAGCDLIFVAFRGQEIFPVLRVLTDRPIVFDAFVSVYDTLCFDREIFRPHSLAGRGLQAYDRLLCRLSHNVLVDTRAHKEYFEQQFGACNVDYLYVGCNEQMFRPLHVERDPRTFTVFWYGMANPLQGVDVILKAAKRLEREEIAFRLAGPVSRRYMTLLRELNLRNVELIDFVPYEQLPVEINRADLCLGGHFSSKDKAGRVIAGKTYQFLACGRPTIVGDNPANRELLSEGGLVHFVRVNDPEALAHKIMSAR